MKGKLHNSLIVLATLAVSALNSELSTCFAQGTAFTYQGRLENDGSAANGTYNLQFTLYNDDTGGTPVTGSVTNTAVGVTNGLFTVTIDFGAEVWNVATNWLQIGVATNGSSSFTTLAPRQEVTPAPYSIFAETAAGVGGLVVEANSDGAPNLIGGSSANFVSGGVVGATIGGGGAISFSSSPIPNSVTADFGTVAGGVKNNASGPGSFIGGGGYDGSSTLGNTANGPASVVCGGLGNLASGAYATTAGGYSNSASVAYATVGGGYLSAASGEGSFVGGGGYDGVNYSPGNTASGGGSVVVGGLYNVASGGESTVGGGYNNTASGLDATVPGGGLNIASGSHSFAAGNFAEAQHNSSFVWSDGEGGGAYYSSDRQNQFKIQAGGGVVMDVSGSSGLNPAALRVNSTSGNGVGLFVSQKSSDATAVFTGSGTGDIIKGFSGSTGGNLVFEVVNNGTVYSQGIALTSDRNAKEHFAPASPAEILEKVAALPISQWNYKADPAELKHLGPTAQDFRAAFGLNGGDDKHISVVDEGGVALAAIQGLNQKLEETGQALRAKDGEIQTLKQKNDLLAERLDELEATVKLLAARK